MLRRFNGMESLLGYLLFSVGVNLLLFLLAYLLRTDKLTDISYSLTFIAIASYSFLQSEQSTVDLVLTLMVIFWGIRLGSYLLYRIQHTGTDKRFDDIRGSFKSFFLFWLMQGLTCFIVMIPVIMAHQTLTKEVGREFLIGGVLAALGWLLEAIADAQKFSFKKQHPDSYMKSGVWAFLQHPNYTGELLFWWAIFLACLPFVPWLAIVGPLWISFIILRFSGISLLQEKWQEKYGNDPDFITHQEKTWKLVPWVY